MFKAQTTHRKSGTPHTLSEQGANRGGDTAHQHRLLEVIGSVRKKWAAGGWVVSSEKWHSVAPSCKLGLSKFSALLRIQDGAECGKKMRTPMFRTKKVS